MKFWDRMKIKARAMDEVLASKLDEKYSKIDDWLTAYKRAGGFTLIGLCLWNVWFQNWTLAALFFCTAYLHQIIHISTTKMRGEKLWQMPESISNGSNEPKT